MDELFGNKHKRRVFLYIVLVTFSLLLLVRIFVVPAAFGSPTPKLIDIINVNLDNLIASGIATVAITGLIFYLNPPVLKRSEIKVLPPFQISSVLNEARQQTREYWFSGGTGRFTRAVTIPQLAAGARAKNQTTNIVIQVIDPSNPDLCKVYADYRNRLRSAGNKSSWTPKRVQIEVCATIVAAYAHRSAQSLLKITVGLKQKYSLFRVDLSSVCVVVTKEDPQEPALMCRADSLFYQSFLEDLRLSLDQATQLPHAECPAPEALNPKNVAEVLTNLGILDPSFSEADLTEIIEKVRNYETPYA